MYTIQNRKTKKFVYGTDYRGGYRQRTSCDQMLTFEYLFAAEAALRNRGCGKDYVIVEIEVKVLRMVSCGNAEHIK